jgi:hypothetical protein
LELAKLFLKLDNIFLNQFAGFVGKFGFSQIWDSHILFPVDAFDMCGNMLAEFIVDGLI